MKKIEGNVGKNSGGSTYFRERLISAMSLRNINNKQLAEEVFVAPSTISSYRTGHRVPDIDQLALLSTTLKVSSDYLLGLSDSINSN